MSMMSGCPFPGRLVAGDRIELDNDMAQFYTIGHFLAVRNSYRPHRTVRPAPTDCANGEPLAEVIGE